ncbi:2-oxoglutarate-dependent dioxygenase 19-like [Phragmites australis]|uniref:2-oxoglutarate-dependent dioxygenase 19-like n=1 Tax=Phragmites australis TaxID=29695 RepID=UPI002D7A0FC8|nr:2-oxoglutarate-dependent dioxygenase 19-like [Phragmites australis]
MAETETSPCHTTGECANGGHSAIVSSGTGACGGDGIPVVDFDVLVNGAADQRAQAIRDLGRACEDWGFFMVINHGVSEALKEAVMETYKELLSLPEEGKAEYLEAGPMDPIRIGSGFYSVVDGARYSRDYLKMFAHPELHCPANPAKLRDVATDYAAKTRGLLLQLAKAISESLGLDGGRISEALSLESCFQILVGNHYPPYTGPDNVGMGLPAHSDHGLLTLLFQNGVDGLQVEHDGQWLLAEPLPGAFFVIAGDQLEIVSNGRYKAVLHRAVVGGERARMSFVSMVSPCLDAVVEPVPELARDGQGLEFRGIRYRDYMAHQQSNKLDGKAALDIARVQRDISGRIEQHN